MNRVKTGNEIVVAEGNMTVTVIMAIEDEEMITGLADGPLPDIRLSTNEVRMRGTVEVEAIKKRAILGIAAVRGRPG